MASLKTWKNALKHAVDYPWDSNIDPDYPNCHNCSNTMVFHGHDESGDFPYGEGYWECPSCGFKVTEAEL